MSRQVLVVLTEPDERSLLEYAFSLGAVLVCGPVKHGVPRLLRSVDDYDASALSGQTFFWYPDASELQCIAATGVVDVGRSDVAEYLRGRITASGALASGRLFVDTTNFARDSAGKPVLLPKDPRTISFYDSMIKFLKKRFVARKHKLGTYYVGPDAWAWHQNGGRLKLMGAAEEVWPC